MPVRNQDEDGLDEVSFGTGPDNVRGDGTVKTKINQKRSSNAYEEDRLQTCNDKVYCMST